MVTSEYCVNMFIIAKWNHSQTDFKSIVVGFANILTLWKIKEQDFDKCCYGYILGGFVRPTFFHGNLACTGVWQTHVSHSRFPPRQWCFLGPQLSTMGRGGGGSPFRLREGSAVWSGPHRRSRSRSMHVFSFLIRQAALQDPALGLVRVTAAVLGICKHSRKEMRSWRAKAICAAKISLPKCPT